MRNSVRAGFLGIASRLMLLATVGVFSSDFASADFPEQLPSYSDTAALREDASLNAVAFRNSLLGIAVGDRGAILKTEDGGTTWQPKESHIECRLDDVVWLSDLKAIVVGGGYDQVTGISRGVVLITIDGG